MTELALLGPDGVHVRLTPITSNLVRAAYGLEATEAARPGSEWRFRGLMPPYETYNRRFFQVHHWPCLAITPDRDADLLGFLFCVETDFRSLSTELCAVAANPGSQYGFVSGIGRYLAVLFSDTPVRSSALRSNRHSASLVSLLTDAGVADSYADGSTRVHRDFYIPWWKEVADRALRLTSAVPNVRTIVDPSLIERTL